METKHLFRTEENGYRCEDVEKYVETLKNEYKKVYEYAKNTEANYEKLKKVCKILKNENTALKENGAVPAEASDVDLSENIKNLAALCAELEKETDAIKAKLNK